MEGVRCARAMRCRIGQRIDNFQLLDDRAGPSVRDDERQRIFMLRANVDEVNVQPIDLGDELRQGVEPCLDLPPVVFRSPIARERLNGRELYALRCIGDQFAIRPLSCVDAPAQFDKFRFRNIYMKRTKRIVRCRLVASLCSTSLGQGVLLLTSIGMFWFVLRLMRVAIVPFPKTTLASRRHVRYSLRTEVTPVATGRHDGS
jgi:hypothetical protein